MAHINKDGSSMTLPMNIRRGNAIPIEPTLVWYDLTALQNYASTGPTAYVGQIVALVDETNSTVTVYIIKDGDGNLSKIVSTAYNEDLMTDFKNLKDKIGDLSTLMTTNKGTLVEAINEIYTLTQNIDGGTY